MEGQEDWLVEKIIIGNQESDILASSPTIWINYECPYLPVVNPGTRPQYIQTGDILGYLKDPQP
jgi:hypothetical protein